MKRFLLPLFFITSLSIASVFAQHKNITLLGHLSYTADLSDIWGYSDSSGREYALVGVYNGVSIVEITDPTQPVERHFISGAPTIWRDIKTWGSYAYVVNEGGGGLLIIDLSGLPGQINTYTWTGGSLGFSTAHNIFIDENGYAYVMGSNVGVGGFFILNLNNDPVNPVYEGIYDVNYVHDGFVRGDTMWAAELNAGFTVIDVSDKANPAILANNQSPTHFTHNTWMSDNNRYLVTTDEVDGGYIGSFDVSDLGNIRELDRKQSNPGSNSAPHNAFYFGDFIIISYYRDGVVIFDATHPDNLIQTGNYDTSPLSGGGFNGCWGVYPWLPSGNVLATDIEEGLFILSPSWVKGCYLTGMVRDSVTGYPLNGVTVEIQGVASTASGIDGRYATGVADSGTYTVVFRKAGYRPSTVSGVHLMNGMTQTLDIELAQLPSFTFSGKVVETSTGNPIANAEVLIQNPDFTVSTTTNGNGDFSVTPFFAGNYTLIAGKWGYKTNGINVVAQQGNPVTISLSKGYYDDFVFDFGWTVTGTAQAGIWELGEPVATSENGVIANPGNDVAGDYGNQCYVTGNGGGNVWDDDIDDGYTVLTSPVFDLAGYPDPEIHFYTWFFNDGAPQWGTPDDTLKVVLSNGSQSVTILRINASDPQSQWVPHTFKVKQYLTPTSSMQISFIASDYSTSGHWVEAGVDRFEVTDSAFTGLSAIPHSKAGIILYPNPFSREITIEFRHDNLPPVIKVYSVDGVMMETIYPQGRRVMFGEALPAGVYILDAGKSYEKSKILKIRND